MKVAAIQIKIPSQDKEENLAHALDLLKRGSAMEARLICLSELFTTPYFAVTEAVELFDLAETIPGPTTDALAKIARELNIYISGSIFERDQLERLYYNCAFLIAPEGALIGKYRKIHIPFVKHKGRYINEKYYFRPGDLGFPVFLVDQLKVGILICYDRSFSEAWRCLALNGAELVMVPTASSGLREESWEFGLRTHALENQLFVIAPNRAGTERFYGENPTTFFGTSLILGPFGNVLAKASRGDKEIISAELDLKDIVEAKHRNDFFRDWRPEAYDIYHKNEGVTPPAPVSKTNKAKG